MHEGYLGAVNQTLAESEVSMRQISERHQEDLGHDSHLEVVRVELVTETGNSKFS